MDITGQLLFLLIGHCLRSIHAQGRASKIVALNELQQESIVQIHNGLRANGVVAGNMQRMVWDPRLAEYAVKRANQCNGAALTSSERQSANVPGYSTIGDNVAFGPESTLPSSIADVISTFFKEKDSWTYGSINDTERCSASTCSHFTQIVWAKSCALGCAAAQCSTLVNGGSVTNGWLAVCIYGPGGNVKGEFPYTDADEQCEDCEDTCQLFLCESQCTVPTNYTTTPLPRPVTQPIIPFLSGLSQGDPCIDLYALCAVWALRGECSTNSGWMQIVCRKSCNLCPNFLAVLPNGDNLIVQGAPPVLENNCVDLDDRCSYWSSIGECFSNQEWMLNNCLGSCSGCNPSQSLKPRICNDSKSQCAAWAQEGLCGKQVQFMEANCKKSCGRC